MLPFMGTWAVCSASQALVSPTSSEKSMSQLPKAIQGWAMVDPEQLASGKKQVYGHGEQTSVSCVPKPCSVYLASLVLTDLWE